MSAVHAPDGPAEPSGQAGAPSGQPAADFRGSPGNTSTTWPAASPTSPPNSATTATTTGFPSAVPRRSTTSAASLTSSRPGWPPSTSAGLDPELRVDAAILGNDVARRIFRDHRAARAHLEPAARQPGPGHLPAARQGLRAARRAPAVAGGRLAAVPGTLAAARGDAGPDAQGAPGDGDRPVRRDDRARHRGGERRAAPGGERRRGAQCARGRGGHRRGRASPACRARRARRAQGLAVGQARGRRRRGRRRRVRRPAHRRGTCSRASCRWRCPRARTPTRSLPAPRPTWSGSPRRSPRWPPGSAARHARCSAGSAPRCPTRRRSWRSARGALEAQTAFVRDHDLVTLYDDPVEVIDMPEIDRGVAVAYCDPPGPLEPVPGATFIAVSPTPKDWTPSGSPRSTASTTGTWCTT